MNSNLKIWRRTGVGTYSRVGTRQFPDGIPVGKGSLRRFELGQSDHIEVKFSSTAAVPFKTGDLCLVEGGCFRVTEPPTPAYNENTAGLDYTLLMQADYRLWGNHRHCLTYAGQRTDSEWKLTALLSDHVQAVLDDIAALGFTHITAISDGGVATATAWDKAIDSDVASAGAKLVEYSNVTILEALDAIAEAYGCEWWVDGATLHFGTMINGSSWPSALPLRQDVEIESLSVNKSEGNYVNRLIVVGGTQNVPANYRKKVILQPTSIALSGGMYIIKDEIRMLRAEDFAAYSETDDMDYPLFLATEQGGSTVTTQLIDQGNGNSYQGFHLYATIDFAGFGRATGNVLNKIEVADLLITDENGEAYSFLTLSAAAYATRGASMADITWIFDSGGGTGYTGTEADLLFNNVEVKNWNGQSAATTITAETVRVRITVLFTGFSSSKTFTLSRGASKAVFRPYAGSATAHMVSGTGALVRYNYNGQDVPCDFVWYSIMSGNTVTDSAIMIPAGQFAFDTEHPSLHYITIPSGQLNEKNVKTSYYSGDPQRQYVRGVAERRLLLPELTGADKERGYKAYTTQDGHGTFYHFGAYIQTDYALNEEEIVEDVEVIEDEFPREQSNGENYFVMDVTSRTEEQKTYFDDGSYIESSIPVYRFKNADATKVFHKSWVEEGSTLSIIFQDGLLAGMTFEVAFNPDGASEGSSAGQVFEIVINETYGRQLPDAVLYPKTGDKYLLTGWSPKAAGIMSIIQPSEQNLLEAGIEKLQWRQLDGKSYEAVLMADTVAIGSAFLTSEGDNFLVSDGTPGAVMIPFYVADPDGGLGIPVKGQRVLLSHAALGLNNVQTRVIGYEYPLDIPFDRPKIMLGMTPQKKRLRALEQGEKRQDRLIQVTNAAQQSRLNALERRIDKMNETNNN